MLSSILSSDMLPSYESVSPFKAISEAFLLRLVVDTCLFLEGLKSEARLSINFFVIYIILLFVLDYKKFELYLLFYRKIKIKFLSKIC